MYSGMGQVDISIIVSQIHITARQLAHVVSPNGWPMWCHHTDGPCGVTIRMAHADVTSRLAHVVSPGRAQSGPLGSHGGRRPTLWALYGPSGGPSPITNGFGYGYIQFMIFIAPLPHDLLKLSPSWCLTLFRYVRSSKLSECKGSNQHQWTLQCALALMNDNHPYALKKQANRGPLFGPIWAPNI